MLVLVLTGVPRMPCVPCPFFMFWQLCVALCEAEGEGVADAALTAVVPVVVPVVVDEVVDEVVDDGEEWLVAALATAMLPPNPTPSAPAPTAVPIMILPSLDLNVSASRGQVMVLGPGHPRWLRARCTQALTAV